MIHFICFLYWLYTGTRLCVFLHYTCSQVYLLSRCMIPKFSEVKEKTPINFTELGINPKTVTIISTTPAYKVCIQYASPSSPPLLWGASSLRKAMLNFCHFLPLGFDLGTNCFSLTWSYRILNCQAARWISKDKTSLSSPGLPILLMWYYPGVRRVFSD